MNNATPLLRLALMRVTCIDTAAESNNAPAAVGGPVRLEDLRALVENCGAVTGWLRKFPGANGCYTFLLRFVSEGRAQNL